MEKVLAAIFFGIIFALFNGASINANGIYWTNQPKWKIIATYVVAFILGVALVVVMEITSH